MLSICCAIRNVDSASSKPCFGGDPTRNSQTSIEKSRLGRLDREHSLFCFIDLRNAYDSVDSRIFRNKLSAYGFERKACDLIYDFMFDRSQFVNLGDVISCVATVSLRVPQGSLFSPMLFTIFLNDLPASSSCMQMIQVVLYLIASCTLRPTR